LLAILPCRAPVLPCRAPVLLCFTTLGLPARRFYLNLVLNSEDVHARYFAKVHAALLVGRVGMSARFDLNVCLEDDDDGNLPFNLNEVHAVDGMGRI
jgi:hypothetical protein